MLTATGIPLEGFYLVVPISVALKLKGDHDTSLRVLDERLKNEVTLNLLPQADAAPPLSEQILACRGSIDGIAKVVEHVLRMLGPKSACDYKPIRVEPEQRGRGAGKEDAGAQAGSSSGPSGAGGHAGTASGNKGDETLTCRTCNRTFIFSVSEQADFKKKNYNSTPGHCQKCRAAKRATRGGKHPKAAQDQASRRGDNTTRNKVRKKANAAKRTAQKNLRGNRGRGRQ